MRTDVINRMLTIFIISFSFFSLSQADTPIYYEEPNLKEYYFVDNGHTYSYLHEYDSINLIETIAKHIHKNGIFMTNKDVNVKINTLAADRRKLLFENNEKLKYVISEEIDDPKAEFSITRFFYYMSDTIKNDIVLRIFDENESCTCSDSLFYEIISIKSVSDAIESKKLKWMTFTFLQNYKDDKKTEYIFVYYKMRWSLSKKRFTLIFEDNK